MQRILIDMDEVIADPMGAMIAWYQNTYGLEVDYKKMLGGSWVRGFPEQHQGNRARAALTGGFFSTSPGHGR